MHNLRKVYNALEEYQKEHGHYPPQQDMHRLLQTLKISGKDLFKTSFIDIRTARYTAPSQNNKKPVLQLHVPPRWYDFRSQSFIVREIGTVENQPGSSPSNADKLR